MKITARKGIWMRRCATTVWQKRYWLDPVQLSTADITQYSLDCFEPMPLTKKCCDEIQEQLQSIPIIYLGDGYTVDLSFVPTKGQDTSDIFEIWIYFNNALLKRCKFVHELQNIYFELLDKELEIENVYP